MKVKKDKIRETLAFQELTPEEKERRGILCRLYGPCADISGPTRNGRKYSNEVWKRTFGNNEIIKELLENGGIPGEAQHPQDRDEIDVEKIAIMMPEAPKEDGNGNLIGYWDVQDTPCGRILYQLAKYGFKLGISSRGTGDVVLDDNGDESVDPETYDFTCFDAVIIPSVKQARLQMVESLDRSNKTLKQALKESLDNAKPDERKVMETTLTDLGIDVDDEEQFDDSELVMSDDEKVNEPVEDGQEIEDDTTISEDDLEIVQKIIDEYKKDEDNENDENDVIISTLEKVYKILTCNLDSEEEVSAESELDNKDEEDEEEVVDDKSDFDTDSLIENLHSVINDKTQLENNVLDLNKKLVVSDTKINELNESVNNFKEMSTRLSKKVSSLKNQHKEDFEKIQTLNSKVEKLNEKLNANKETINKLFEDNKNLIKDNRVLSESVSKLKKNVKLNENLSNNKETLKEELQSFKEKYNKDINELKQELKEERLQSNASTKALKETVDRYISLKANTLGIDLDEIKSRLKENFTLNDVDTLCKELDDYNFNLKQLPFNITKDTKVRITESKHSFNNFNQLDDDYVDDSLLALAKIK